jgi:hypothetical protein
MTAKGRFDFKFATLPKGTKSEWIVLPHDPQHIEVMQHWLPDEGGKQECFACPRNWGEVCALCDYAAHTEREAVQQRLGVARRFYVYALAGEDLARTVLTMTDVAWRAFGAVLADPSVVAEHRLVTVRPAKTEAGGVWWNCHAGEPVELDSVPAPIDLWKTVRATSYSDSMDRLVHQIESGGGRARRSGRVA